MPSGKRRGVSRRLRNIPQEHFRNGFSRIPSAPPKTQISALAVLDIPQEQPLQEVPSTPYLEAVHIDEQTFLQTSVPSFREDSHQPLHGICTASDAPNADENRLRTGGYPESNHRNFNGLQRIYNPVVQTQMLLIDTIQTDEFIQGIAVHGQVDMEEHNYLVEASTMPMTFETNPDDEYGRLYLSSRLTPLHPNYIDLGHIYSIQAQQQNPLYFDPVSNSSNSSDTELSATANSQYLPNGYNYPEGSGWSDDSRHSGNIGDN